MWAVFFTVFIRSSDPFIGTVQGQNVHPKLQDLKISWGLGVKKRLIIPGKNLFCECAILIQPILLEAVYLFPFKIKVLI